MTAKSRHLMSRKSVVTTRIGVSSQLAYLPDPEGIFAPALSPIPPRSRHEAARLTWITEPLHQIESEGYRRGGPAHRQDTLLHHFRVQTTPTATAAPQRFRVIDSVDATEQAQPHEIDFCRPTVAALRLTLYRGVPLMGLGALVLGFVRNLGSA